MGMTACWIFGGGRANFAARILKWRLRDLRAAPLGRTERRSEVCQRPGVGDSGVLVDRQELAVRRRNGPFDNVFVVLHQQMVTAI